MISAFALLVQETTKLTLGQDLTIKVPHEVNTLLQGDPTNGCQHLGLLNIRDFYVRTPMSLLSLVQQKVDPHMIAKKS